MNYNYSLVIPVFRNEKNITELFERINEMHQEFKENNKSIEFILVLDGTPDNSLLVIRDNLKHTRASIKVINLWKNLGSAQAIRVGFMKSSGEYIAVMAADLQEPSSLFKEMYKEIENQNIEIVLGVRKSRKDPLVSRTFSSLYWRLWSKALGASIPAGGADVFCITTQARDYLLSKNQNSTALIASLIDLKMPTTQVFYEENPTCLRLDLWIHEFTIAGD